MNRHTAQSYTKLFSTQEIQRALHLAIISIIVCLATINLIWFLTFSKQKQILGTTTNLTPSQIISLTNLERIKAGLTPLTPNEKLNQAAEARADNMLSSQEFAHYYQNETGQITPWQFFNQAGYKYHYAGENLARHFFDSTLLLEAWMRSSNHKQNILNPNYQDIGVAVREGKFIGQENSTLIVQLFGAPIPPGFTLDQSDDSNNTHQTNFVSGPKKQSLTFVRNYPPSLLSLAAAATVVVLGLRITESLFTKQRQTHASIKSSLWRH